MYSAGLWRHYGLTNTEDNMRKLSTAQMDLLNRVCSYESRCRTKPGVPFIPRSSHRTFQSMVNRGLFVVVGGSSQNPTYMPTLECMRAYMPNVVVDMDLIAERVQSALRDSGFNASLHISPRLVRRAGYGLP